MPRDRFGSLFEQFVGLELISCGRLSSKKIKIMFWRDPDGPKVDWVVEYEDEYIPVEVRWTDVPTKRDIKHLELFLAEYKEAKTAYLICQVPRKLKLAKDIYAIPWQEIDKLILK